MYFILRLCISVIFKNIYSYGQKYYKTNTKFNVFYLIHPLFIFSGGVKNKKYTLINTIKNSIMKPIDLIILLDFKKPSINKEIDITPRNNKIIDIESSFYDIISKSNATTNPF